MHHEKYRHFTSPLPKHYEEGESQEPVRRVETNAQTPKHRPEPIMTAKREVAGQTAGDLLNVPSNHSPVAFSASQDDKRLRLLIADAISSADRAIKAILPYGHLEIQKHCSLYFLNREKLFSFLDSSSQSFYSSAEMSGKKQKKKHRKREEVSSELIEMVPINHLERLEKIVYNKIIPILQTEFDSQKRKSQKHPKKAKEWGNSDFKEGLILLERLNGKERIAVDQCAEILERFIIRIMEKEEKMLVRLAKLQERLDQEIKKTEILAQESKKWEDFRLKSEKEWGRQKRTLLKYQEFSKEVKSLLSEKEKTDSQVSDKEGLESLLQQIKKMANDERKHSKKCDHRSHKEIHSNCKEESVRNQQQIKSLKDVVKSLDNEICLLRQECQSMENQIKANNEKTSKVETKSKKVIQENQSMNNKIDQLIRENNYKGKLIEQYLRIISRLEESLKNNQEKIIKVNQENQGYLEMVNKHSSEKEDYIRHIMEIEEKQKQLEEIIARKQIEIQELIIHLNSKDREVRDSQHIIQKMQGEIHSLYELISTKEETIAAQSKENEQLNEQLKHHEKIQNLKGSSHEDVSIQQEHSQKEHQSEIHIRYEQEEESKQKFQTLQHIANNQTTAKQGKAERQVSLTLDSKTPLEQLKSQMKRIAQQNTQLKFQLQRIKTFKAIQHSNNSANAINCQERQELNNLRNIVRNIGRAPKQQKPLQVIGHQILPDESHALLKPLQKTERHESENAVDERQLLIYTKLKAQKKDDFIPAHINKLVIPAATLEEEINDASFEQDEKGSKRDDFIPADVNKQSIYYSKRKDESRHHSLKDQIQPLEPRFDHQMAQILQPQTDELISEDLIELKEVGNDLMKAQGEIGQVQPSKIQELLDLNVQIGQNFIKLKQKYQKQQKFSGELTQIKKEIDYMTALLNIYKHNTLKKLQKLKKTQLLHKQAEQEVDRLRHRLDDAIGAIRPFSSIRTNSEGSGFSMPDHLQSFFKHNNPFVDQQQLHQYTEQHQTKPRQNRQIFTQTDEQRNISRRLAAVAIESQVIIQTSSPLVSEIQERPACDVTKSFINQLEIISPSADVNNPRIEPVINNTNTFLTPELLKEIPVDANPESSDSAKKEEQVLQIGNMINYHKHQIMNLHKMLRAETSEMMQEISTPKKHPFENEDYMRYITNAPEKEKLESSCQQQNRCDVACFHVEQIEQLKEMFAQRQQELSQLVVEKDQEIERLKSIIKTLTKVQEVQDKSSIKASRNRQSASREIQHLKNQNEHLWMFLEKEKSEIERLRILIQQYQLNEEIYKLKNGATTHKHEEEAKKETTYDILMHQPIQANQNIFYERTPAKKQLEQVLEQQGDQLVKSQNLDVEVENHELLVESDRKAKEEPVVSTPLKVQESPSKRFTRKSQKFQQQETPRQRRNTSPSKTLQMGWQQLVPEFFGQKSKRSSPRHSDKP